MKKVSTLIGILVIIATAIVLFGGAFIYEYFAGKIQPIIQPQQLQKQQNTTSGATSKSTTSPNLTIDQQKTIVSKDGTLSAYIKDILDTTTQKGTSETHLINNQTKEDSIYQTYTYDEFDYCFLKEFSPNNQYLVSSCGTGVVRSLDFLNLNTKKDFSYTGSDTSYIWLNNDEILNDPVIYAGKGDHTVNGWYETCTDGYSSGIQRVNLISGQAIVLKTPDELHTYGVLKLLPDGTILYILETSTKPFDCFQIPIRTYWVMGINGNTIKQVDANYGK